MTAKALTVQAAGLPEQRQPLPSLLASLLVDPQVPHYGGEHGFDTKPGPWSPPAVVDDATRVAARQALGDYDRLLETKATRRQAMEWALSLMMLVGGRQATADEAKAKAAAYAEMLIEYPACLLTRESLQKTAGVFKFFPAYAELAERLDLDLWRLKREQKRLLVLAAIQKPKAETEAADVIRSAVKPMPAKKADTKPDPKPEKASAIVHPPSAEQLAEWAKGVGA